MLQMFNVPGDRRAIGTERLPGPPDVNQSDDVSGIGLRVCNPWHNYLLDILIQ